MRSIVVALIMLASLMGDAYPRDDGRYAQSPLKPWFDKLKSAKGMCCSDADGNVVQDADWESKDGHYRVYLEGRWIDVPDNAVITEPNLYGRTMVWPLRVLGFGGGSGPVGAIYDIRCFMPGPGS